MAKLTTAARNALPDSAFAIPSQRKYPIFDKSHQDNAMSRVSQYGSSGEKAIVREKVGKKRGFGLSRRNDNA